MKKPVVPRILGFLALYCLVFIAIVIIQFTSTDKGNFTRRINGMLVSGQYLLNSESAAHYENGGEESSSSSEESGSGAAVPENSYYLSGGASLSFGGLEFSLRNRDGNETFVFISADNELIAAAAESVSFSEDAAHFLLSGGSELVFQVYSGGGLPELRISGYFASGISGLDIPVKLNRKTAVREINDGVLSITYDSVTYQFNRPVQIRESAVLALQTGMTSVLYRAIQEQKEFNPLDYVIANARGRQAYSDAITRWVDQSFTYWRLNISQQADEDMVNAFCSEAVKHGMYREALTMIDSSFMSSSRRSYGSSVFTGGMGSAFRYFVQAERDRASRISRMIHEASPDLLTERHIIESLFIRGNISLVDETLEMIRGMDPASLTQEMCPGIFEGYADTRHFLQHGDNPFERLIDQACDIFSGGLYKNTEKDLVFVFKGNTADSEYNLRLGKALIAWAGAAGRDEWADLGHSLILSVLSMQNNSGAVPVFISIDETGGLSNLTGSTLSAAAVYRIISPGDYYPRALAIGSVANGMWAWTAASVVTATQEGHVLDISASFPNGETHHMMIRGIRPFTKIQIYNMDYPTDPQFEIYDSSGWVYSAQEHLLTVKLKHRGPVEHVRIFY